MRKIGQQLVSKVKGIFKTEDDFDEWNKLKKEIEKSKPQHTSIRAGELWRYHEGVNI